MHGPEAGGAREALPRVSFLSASRDSESREGASPGEPRRPLSPPPRTRLAGTALSGEGEAGRG